ncbi:MAG: heme lyase CcmF/NrfE family subunit [Cellvibrionaceae bacterium]
MVPELGHFALLIALCLAVGVAVVPMVGSYTGNTLLMQSGRSMAVGLFLFALFSFLCLVWAFTHDDFSVAYVASNSNSLLPIYYKLTATWGGHEGSLLLWILMSCCWLLAVSFFARSLPMVIHSRVLAIMGWTAVGILLFTIFTSNPFERILPGSPAEGSDLNPLLQDVGFIIHPPMLYIGFSGFSVAFAFAITALLSGHLDSAWARWSRPWTNIAWGFLTLGIGLGSWWAYYELGWGFWWGWDPTENNSLIPWLTATALVHSLAVTEKRGLFKTWTILLAIATFCLILLGTFITRSGVVNSVHAFANDPERGAFLLGYIVVVATFSLLLYALKAPSVASLSAFRLSARETFMLSNNILLTILMATVLLGTIYPMISEGFGWGTVSVGAPYFNFFWVLLVVPLCMLMGASSLSQWKQTSAGIYKKYLKLPVLISLVVAIIFPFIYGDSYRIGGAVTAFVVTWIVAATISGLLRQTRNAPSFWAGLRQLKLGYYSMSVAHLGVALLFLGAGLTSIYDNERNLILQPGASQELFGYHWRFGGVQEVRGPNYLAEEGQVWVSRGDRVLAELAPQKRYYLSGAMVTTEAAIQGNLWRDLYVSLGEATEPRSAGGWVITVYVKPFIAFIWMGIILMSAGGLMALFDKRYRYAQARKDASDQAGSASALGQATS